MPDVIVEEALKAVQGFTGGQSVRTNRSGTPLSNGGRAISSGNAELTVSTKGSGYLGVDDQPAGSAMNPIAQVGLFNKIRAESSWLRFTTFVPVTENTGYLDLWDDRNFRMHPSASEGPRRNIPLHRPDLSQKSYETKLMSGAFGIRLKSIRTAARAGQNVNDLIRQGIAAGIGNVLADLGINGDESLPDDTDLNKQRRVTDGWFKKIRDNSDNYQGRTDGFSYHNGIWSGMLQQIDKAYRTDKGLAWGVTDSLSTRWLTELSAMGSNPSNAHPSIVNPLGSALLNAAGAQANPLGRPGVVIPQMEDDRASTEGYAGVAPTSVVNNGDGTLTININTLANSGVDRSSTGEDGQRYVVIGSASTGVYETVAVDYAAPNNTVTTSSLLGQTVPSTTASDYYVRWADTQSVFLGTWRMLALVIQNGMRVYSVFYPQDEVIEIIVHMDLDYMVADYDSMSLVDDLITPRFDIFG